MQADRGRISEFFGREWARLSGYVRRRLEDSAEEDAADLVQDVFASVFERAEFMGEIENLSAYVYRSLRNRISDSLRRRRKDLSLDAPLADSEEDLRLADVLASDDEDALDALQRRQREEAFEAAFQELSERERELIVANEFEGLAFREISEATGEPVGTLLSRKSRAVAKLAAALVDHDPHT
jgi:RNA polymerase sigma factor (sigma-70 family)